MKKFFLAAFLVSIIGFGGVAEAQTTTTVLQSPNVQKLAALEVQVQSAQMELIKQLIAQVTALQEQLSRLLADQVSVPTLTPTPSRTTFVEVDLKIDGQDGSVYGKKPGLAVFSWKTKNADTCSASTVRGVTGTTTSKTNWIGEKKTSGSEKIWIEGDGTDFNTAYHLNCQSRYGYGHDVVSVTFYNNVSSPMLELTSPSGGEAYDTSIPELNIEYRSKSLKGEEVIAYLHKSDKPYGDYQRSTKGLFSSDSGKIVMGMQKGGPEAPGKYKITICALVPGKDFCRTSGTFELVASETDYFVNIKLVPRYNSVYGVHAELSYEIPKLRDGLTFWAEPEAYCNDAATKQGCADTSIFFAWSEGGVKGDGGKMNPYVKGGASYQLPTSLNKSFITTTTVDPRISYPDSADIRFILRNERGRELWSWTGRLPFQFKG